MSNKKTIGQQLKLEIDRLSERMDMYEQNHNSEISQLNRKLDEYEQDLEKKQETIDRLKKVVFSLLLQAPTGESDKEDEEDDLDEPAHHENESESQNLVAELLADEL